MKFFNSILNLRKIFVRTNLYAVGMGVIVALSIMIYSCNPTQSPEPTQPSLGLLLAKNLEDTLRNKPLGYAFVIYEGTKLVAQGAGGVQAQVADGGAKSFTIDTKLHIASMTKTLTAMAFLKAAQQKNLRSSDRIISYLPPNWVKGIGISQITFADLLTHRSGIVGLADNCINGSYSENIYAGLKQLIAKGVTKRGTRCYQNANFGLFRILIPSILGYKFTGNEATDDAETQRLYLDFLQQQIFDKVGVNSVSTASPTSNLTYTYNYPVSATQKGWNPGNFSSTMGGYGIYLTAAEAGKVFAHAFSSTDILTQTQTDTIFSKGFGCYGTAITPGSYYYHDGWWYSSLSASGQGLRTIWMNMYGNITCVLFVNALRWQNGSLVFPFNYGNLPEFVYLAYSKAYQARNGRISFEQINATLKTVEPH